MSGCSVLDIEMFSVLLAVLVLAVADGGKCNVNTIKFLLNKCCTRNFSALGPI